jgi:hypothetical protein
MNMVGHPDCGERICHGYADLVLFQLLNNYVGKYDRTDVAVDANCEVGQKRTAGAQDNVGRKIIPRTGCQFTKEIELR